MIYPTGMREGSAPDKFYFIDPSFRNELYLGFWFMVGPGWYPSGATDKIFFIMGLQGGAYASMVIPMLWGPSNDGNSEWMGIYFPSSTDNCHLTNLIGGCPGSAQLFGNYYRVSIGVWHRIEVYTKRSTSTTSRNGIVRVWVDGNEAMNYQNVNFEPAQGFKEYQIDPTFGGNGDNFKPHNDHFYYDHVRISDPSTATGAPTANFTGTPSSGQIPLAVQFTDTSAGTPTGWSWTFGETSSTCSPYPGCNQSNAQHPQHTYQVAGTYTVALTASNANGSNTLTRSNYITATSGTAPNAPTNLRQTSIASPTSDMRVDLAWDAPASGPSPTGYNLYQCMKGNGVQTPVACSPLQVGPVGNVLNYSVTNLVPGTVYTFAVTATGDGESSQSNLLDATTTQDGISSLYAGDVNIENDSRVRFVERFDAAGGIGTGAVCGTLTGTGVRARYNDALNPGNMSVVADGPQYSNNLALQIANGPSTLYKNLAAVGLNTANPVFLRYYMKLIGTLDNFKHTGVWLGGMLDPGTGACGASAGAPCNCAFPRAGCQPTGTDLFHVGVEKDDFASRWNSYLYWMGMRPDNTGCPQSEYNCSIVHEPTCYWGNTTLNEQTFSLAADTWYLVEVMVKPNNPVSAMNGELAAWINGVKVLHDGVGFPIGAWSGGGATGNFTVGAGSTPFEGFQWRNTSALDVNYLWLQNFTEGAATVRLAHVVLADALVGQIEPPSIPVADFTASPLSGNAPLVVQFTDTSSGSPTEWSWDFGDPASGANNTSTLQGPSHTYNSSGQYTVTLIATNANGPSLPMVKTNYITVTGDTQAPDAPTGVTASAQGPDRVFVTWNANSEGDLAGYHLWRGGFLVCTTTRLYCTERGLAPNTNYTYAVDAYDVFNNTSTQSSTASATTDAAPATTVILTPTATTWIGLDNVNYSPQAVLNLYTWQAGQVANAALLMFNTAASIPDPATVTSAKLYLLQNAPGSVGTFNVPVHRITNVMPNLAQATGDLAATGVPWTANACCEGGHPMAQADIAAAQDTVVTSQLPANSAAWRVWDVTPIVQAWVAGTQVERGLLLNPDLSAGIDANRRFASLNETFPGNRPFMVVTYTGVDLTPPAAPANLHVVRP